MTPELREALMAVGLSLLVGLGVFVGLVWLAWMVARRRRARAGPVSREAARLDALRQIAASDPIACWSALPPCPRGRRTPQPSTRTGTMSGAAGVQSVSPLTRPLPVNAVTGP